MKITAVRILRLSGTMQTHGAFWEDRLVRPIDIYPEYRRRNDFEGGTQVDASHFRLQQHFIRIETDEGPHGIAGPLPDMVALFTARRLRPDYLGQGPDRARNAVGSDAPHHGPWPAGRRHAGDQRS